MHGSSGHGTTARDRSGQMPNDTEVVRAAYEMRQLILA